MEKKKVYVFRCERCLETFVFDVCDVKSFEGLKCECCGRGLNFIEGDFYIDNQGFLVREISKK